MYINILYKESNNESSKLSAKSGNNESVNVNDLNNKLILYNEGNNNNILPNIVVCVIGIFNDNVISLFKYDNKQTKPSVVDINMILHKILYEYCDSDVCLFSFYIFFYEQNDVLHEPHHHHYYNFHYHHHHHYYYH